jgi:hypothetical protein
LTGDGGLGSRVDRDHVVLSGSVLGQEAPTMAPTPVRLVVEAAAVEGEGVGRRGLGLGLG